jgi:CBS domain-containing protein
MSTRYATYQHFPIPSRIDADAKRAPSDQFDQQKSNLTARDLMTNRVSTIRPEDSLESAARLMSESECGAIPVVDEFNRLVGIITNRDITTRAVAKGLSIPHAQVSDCMTKQAFACSVHNTLESCARGMSWHQVRRIPIVDDEHRVIGMISQGELARFAFDHPEQVKIDTLTDIVRALAY